MADKKMEKGFCPFCGKEFSGDHDNCPFCGQNLKPYKDDLGPVLDKIQTATNIDMKSLKVRVTMSIVIFILVFAGALVIFDYYEKNKPVPEPEPEPVVPEGLVVELRTDGYLDLMDDFVTKDLVVLPLYDPDLRLNISLSEKYRDNGYTKIMWSVQTDYYNDDNPMNPFYVKVTKESTDLSDMYSVTWDNLRVGRFAVTASCYLEDGEVDIIKGWGNYHGSFSKTYKWNFGDRDFSIDYNMSTDLVNECLLADLRDRVDKQSISSMRDYVSDGMYISELGSKLRSAYDKSFSYSDVNFADFVLSFVQTCFPDVYDSYNYRVSDYWAYPAETILWGCGDDEDRAILYCSILKDAGMDVGLLLYPDTTITAVRLDTSLSPIHDYAKTVRGLYTTYTIADTSSDLGIGRIRDHHDVSEDGRSIIYNGTEYLTQDRLLVI